MRKPYLVAVLVGLLVTGAAHAATWTLKNPTDIAYTNEPVRLGVDVPEGEFTVKADGRAVPYQVEEIDGRRWILVAATIEPGASVKCTVEPGKPAKAAPLVSVKRIGDAWELDNGLVAVRVPAEAKAGADVPGPIAGLRPEGGKWIGRSVWHTKRAFQGLESEVLGDGTVRGRVRVVYRFEGTSGVWGDSPARAVIDVTLEPGARHAAIEESHDMDRGDSWELEAGYGWRPTDAIPEIFGGAAGKPMNREMWPKDFTPLPEGREALDARYANSDPRLGDVLMWLVPRWNQHYEDGWLFAAADRAQAVAAMPIRAARWFWPHDNKIEVTAHKSGDYVGFRCPTWRGRRLWLLYAGPRGPVDTVRTEIPPRREGDRPRLTYDTHGSDYVFRYAWRPLDKIVHTYITDWPGNPDAAGGLPAWTSAMNPLRFPRGFMGGSHGGGGAQTPLQRLVECQIMLDPDYYGSYWNFWSPTNPNFYTSLMGGPMGRAVQFKDHPRFKELAHLVEMRYREDVYHSATLPGGASQECPGYYFIGAVRKRAEQLRALGFDGMKWPRLHAGPEFLWRISQPRVDGDRVYNPAGDTHPSGNGPKSVEAWRGSDPKSWKTEEFPGFGVVFKNRPGTPDETYLSFKSGPNRGHYHGDQLAFHWCAYARPVAVDHFCSYKPRAGEEHMHNRVAFATDDLPFANMDGYERLIAFVTGDAADAAIGQVESDRLRITTETPPEDWDRDQPQIRFEKPMAYRRTVVQVKGGPADYFVIRDQYAGAPAEGRAIWCFHAYGNRVEHRGKAIDFDPCRVFVASPAKFGFDRWDWAHANGGGERTVGIRLSVPGGQGEFITVLYPKRPKGGPEPDDQPGAAAAYEDGPVPEMAAIPGGVRVGDDEVTFAGGIDDDDGATYVTVKRGGKVVLSLTGRDIDMDRSQGEIGLFVPDTGYPFGHIPDWLIRQRCAVPDWAAEWVGSLWPDRIELARKAAEAAKEKR